MCVFSFPVSPSLRLLVEVNCHLCNVALSLATGFFTSSQQECIKTYILFMWQQYLPTKNTLCTTETAVSLFTNTVPYEDRYRRIMHVIIQHLGTAKY